MISFLYFQKTQDTKRQFFTSIQFSESSQSQNKKVHSQQSNGNKNLQSKFKVPTKSISAQKIGFQVLKKCRQKSKIKTSVQDLAAQKKGVLTLWLAGKLSKDKGKIRILNRPVHHQQ